MELKKHITDERTGIGCINDGIDIEEGENEIALFKNILNEMYTRDISKKVRSSHRLRGSMGEPLSHRADNGINTYEKGASKSLLPT